VAVGQLVLSFSSLQAGALEIKALIFEKQASLEVQKGVILLVSLLARAERPRLSRR